MRLGSAFGAFLDPVADKVHTLFFDITCVSAYWFVLVEFLNVFWTYKSSEFDCPIH